MAAIVFAALGRRENADAPEAPPPPSREEGALLAPVTAFDRTIIIKAGGGEAGPAMGTAFSIGDKGVWLTARHVVAGCARIALIEAPGRGALARLAPEPAPLSSSVPAASTDLAVLFTEGGAPALPLLRSGGLRIGERSFHPGFPQGGPGETTGRLLGRQTLVLRARGLPGRAPGGRVEHVLAWAEAGRTNGLHGDLSGLSGAPALDSHGDVVGVTIAQAPRRGRIYTTSPEAIRDALLRAHVTPGPAPLSEPITVENYGRVADSLRRDLRVAQVTCVAW